jgi:tetratricopeptide (TPR) repeat protein
VLTDKGVTPNSLGNYTRAIESYDKALAIDPKDRYALSNKGWALGGLGNYTGANVTFCYLPVHYVRYYPLMFIPKKNNQPVPNLSKECIHPATIYFCFKFVWIITTPYVNINCAIRIKYIVNMTCTQIFRMAFSKYN